MPYLSQERKDELAGGDVPRAPGDLNYQVTLELLDLVRGNERFALPSRLNKLVDAYIDQHGVSYTTYNNVIGALTCAGMEFKRRVPSHLWVDIHHVVHRELVEYAQRLYNDTVAPYEDLKIEENGDVYP